MECESDLGRKKSGLQKRAPPPIKVVRPALSAFFVSRTPIPFLSPIFFPDMDRENSKSSRVKEIPLERSVSLNFSTNGWKHPAMQSF
ncbi:hypothetical protein SUGI_0858420 [Cryptomeria japonica]|nr:hypothetical protein SUGI_0858420 [Cryptomeria japonica]